MRAARRTVQGAADHEECVAQFFGGEAAPCEAERADVRRLPFADGDFDTVVSMFSRL